VISFNSLSSRERVGVRIKETKMVTVQRIIPISFNSLSSRERVGVRIKETKMMTANSLFLLEGIGGEELISADCGRSKEYHPEDTQWAWHFVNMRGHGLCSYR
jgi:hypothetical protein